MWIVIAGCKCWKFDCANIENQKVNKQTHVGLHKSAGLNIEHFIVIFIDKLLYNRNNGIFVGFRDVDARDSIAVHAHICPFYQTIRCAWRCACCFMNFGQNTQTQMCCEQNAVDIDCESCALMPPDCFRSVWCALGESTFSDRFPYNEQ